MKAAIPPLSMETLENIGEKAKEVFSETVEGGKKIVDKISFFVMDFWEFLYDVGMFSDNKSIQM